LLIAGISFPYLNLLSSEKYQHGGAILRQILTFGRRNAGACVEDGACVSLLIAIGCCAVVSNYESTALHCADFNDDNVRMLDLILFFLDTKKSHIMIHLQRNQPVGIPGALI
jgi:hypothetical protein